MNNELMTARQLEVFEFIEDFIGSEQMPPTRADICKHFGWASPNAAEDNIKALVRKGVLEIVPGRARGLRVIV